MRLKCLLIVNWALATNLIGNFVDANEIAFDKTISWRYICVTRPRWERVSSAKWRPLCSGTVVLNLMRNWASPYARFSPNSRGTWDWLTTKNYQTRGYSGVGRQGRMFLLCYSPEGHKLLLNTRNNSGLLAIGPRPLLAVKNGRGTCQFLGLELMPIDLRMACEGRELTSYYLANYTHFVYSYVSRSPTSM